MRWAAHLLAFPNESVSVQYYTCGTYMDLPKACLNIRVMGFNSFILSITGSEPPHPPPALAWCATPCCGFLPGRRSAEVRHACYEGTSAIQVNGEINKEVKFERIDAPPVALTATDITQDAEWRAALDDAVELKKRLTHRAFNAADYVLEQRASGRAKVMDLAFTGMFHHLFDALDDSVAGPLVRSRLGNESRRRHTPFELVNALEFLEEWEVNKVNNAGLALGFVPVLRGADLGRKSPTRAGLRTQVLDMAQILLGNKKKKRKAYKDCQGERGHFAPVVPYNDPEEPRPPHD